MGMAREKGGWIVWLIMRGEVGLCFFRFDLGGEEEGVRLESWGSGGELCLEEGGKELEGE